MISSSPKAATSNKMSSYYSKQHFNYTNMHTIAKGALLLLKHAQNIALSSWHGSTKEHCASTRPVTWKLDLKLEIKRDFLIFFFKQTPNTHFGKILQRNRLSHILIIKNYLQIYNSTFVCTSRKALSNTRFPPLDLKKLGFLHCPWSVGPCRAQTQECAQDRQTGPETAAGLHGMAWQQHPGLALASRMLMIITQQRPAASNEISSGFGKGLCSSLKQDQKCWLRAVAVTEALVNATCSFRTTTGKDIEIYSNSVSTSIWKMFLEVLPAALPVMAAEARNKRAQMLWGQQPTSCAMGIKTRFTLPRLSPSSFLLPYQWGRCQQPPWYPLCPPQPPQNSSPQAPCPPRLVPGVSPGRWQPRSAVQELPRGVTQTSGSSLRALTQGSHFSPPSPTAKTPARLWIPRK